MSAKISSSEFNTRQTSMLAEELPLQVLDRIGDLKPGASLLAPRPTGALVLTVLQAEPLPIERAEARDAIRSYLSNERRRQARFQTELVVEIHQYPRDFRRHRAGLRR